MPTLGLALNSVAFHDHSQTGLSSSTKWQAIIKREITGIKATDNITISDKTSPIDIWSGDLSNPQDGAINMEDIMEISKSFGHVKGESGYVESRDVDGNSAINIQDIIILAKHFNKISEAYPAISSY